MIHADSANVPKAQIKEKLAKLMKAKEDSIQIVGLKTKFGGGRSSGMALIYDNAEMKKKYDCKARLKAVSESLGIPYVVLFSQGLPNSCVFLFIIRSIY